METDQGDVSQSTGKDDPIELELREASSAILYVVVIGCHWSTVFVRSQKSGHASLINSYAYRNSIYHKEIGALIQY